MRSPANKFGKTTTTTTTTTTNVAVSSSATRKSGKALADKVSPVREGRLVKDQSSVAKRQVLGASNAYQSPDTAAHKASSRQTAPVSSSQKASDSSARRGGGSFLGNASDEKDTLETTLLDNPDLIERPEQIRSMLMEKIGRLGETIRQVQSNNFSIEDTVLEKLRLLKDFNEQVE